MSRQKVASIAIIACALTGIMESCSDKHDDFGDFNPLPAAGWAYGDTVSFNVHGLRNLPPAGRRSLKIGVRHHNDYAYRNLIMEVTYTDGMRLVRDTVNMELADVYGAWLGSGVGPVYQKEATVNTSAAIPDSSTVSVRHVMRVDTLPGIEQIGIIIEKP
ncbi:MAG: gliding motility lipoprotein GldH [Firmicutes bacterium]|nr:gliding motility lipoprotein GldH [Bacillota bacterium]MCM1400539.1 gliding motility lipoprotein GldH [Bacteroides sp.]MCM1476443.1 gliding motility lipoprotein GldH [Bacteroides sp.]